MSIGGDLDPHRSDRARLVVQGAVGPFDRLFEASRGEMSDADISGVTKGQRIKWAQTACPFNGFDRRVGLVANRVDKPSEPPGVSCWIEPHWPGRKRLAQKKNSPRPAVVAAPA